MSNYVKIKKHFATSAFLFNILIPVKVLQSIFLGGRYIMNSTNKQKHNLLVVLEEVLEYRKTTFSTLATYQWEKKVSKKITNYFSRETYIEDLTVKNIRDFFSSIRFKENGELMSTKYLKSVKTIMQAVFQ